LLSWDKKIAFIGHSFPCNALAAGSGGRAFAGCLAARKKRQRQNRLPDLIFYDHHQSRIVVVRIVAALFFSSCIL